ncbi:phosphate ABC transporter permease subunit PstC [Endomicrobium proavitum]|uniref:Phosphate transport system permease protein n=1 Tax=Endomicrobium proavitum TaxID=1408281 RepID=A0A0G3WKK4_9BACT|nr:phosphate ABC transporter permease subunit PstC [Endomicrobium proavitum]AKL98417.1 Phosphate ABC transporter, permease protein PstA [Endomicrobium proavitum]
MNSFKEKFIKAIFCVIGFSSLLFLLAIVVSLFKGSCLSLTDINQLTFLFSSDWAPYYDPAEYGILSLIISSVFVSLVAGLICVPLGLGTALYLYELAGSKQRKILKPVIEILSGIPSIVFGFFGLAVLAPFMRSALRLPSGLCVLTAAIILGVMTIPVITSIAEDALSFVPKSFREASYALGGNRWQTLIKVIVPAAASGISTSVILAISRIMGETMIVLMIAGGATAIPTSLFSPARPMTSTIAAEMGEAAYGSLHFSALFEIGLILFFITLILNYIAEKISKKYRLKLGHGR